MYRFDFIEIEYLFVYLVHDNQLKTFLFIRQINKMTIMYFQNSQEKKS